jgi:WD40 repeat protein/serine/threonine protein kinase
MREMSADWDALQALFEGALGRPKDQRAAFLDEHTNGDAAVRREVESLLAAHESAGGFLSTPAIGPSTPPVLTGTMQPVSIAGYRILRKIDEGGMGVVYEAEQRYPQRRVALKVIRAAASADEYQIRLFQREVQALARLKHPGIAAIHEAGVTAESEHFFTMELVLGVPLTEYVRGRRLEGMQPPSSPQERLELFLSICEAIGYAHQRGVIHRDLKPTNILVVASEGHSVSGKPSGTPHVKVLDFGLARVSDDAQLTQVYGELGLIKGTLQYMSPEQARGEPDAIDVRSDVYSLGVILYELMTDRLPYDVQRKSVPEAIRIICEEPPTSIIASRSAQAAPTTKAGRIDRDVDTIVLKALEKEAARRYPSATALGDDVGRYLTQQPILARAPSAVYQLRKLVARHKAPFALLAALFVVLVGFAITMTVQSMRITAQRDKAIAAERVAAEQRDAADQQRTAAEQMRHAEQTQRLSAEANFQRAEEQRRLADEQRLRAEQQELANRRQLYVSHMNEAMQAWETANVPRMQELLESHVPTADQIDLRGFEWYYMWQLFHSSGLFTWQHVPSAQSAVSVALSPDGQWAASLAGNSTTGRTVAIYNTATGHRLRTLKPANSALSLAFSPDSEKLVTGERDGVVSFWDIRTGQTLGSIQAHREDREERIDGTILRTLAVAFSPDGRLLATGGQTGTVKLWDVSSRQQSATLTGHTGAINAVAFSRDGKMVASGSVDTTAKLWDVSQGRELAVLDGQKDRIQSVAFSPDAKKLATSGVGGVKLWDVTTGQELSSYPHATCFVYGVAFSPDGKTLVIPCGDRTVRFWDAATGRELASLRGHGDRVTSVALSGDGRRLVTGSLDGTARLWDLTVDQGPASLEQPTRAQVMALAYSPDGRKLAAGSTDGLVRLWDVATRQESAIFKHTRQISALAYSPNGQRLVTASSDKTVTLWDVASGQELVTFAAEAPRPNAVAFSPDSKRLATRIGGTTVQLWEVPTGRGLTTIKGPAQAVEVVAFSPDGNRLATAGRDGTIRLWDVATAQLLITIDGDTSWIVAAAFSPDGRLLATASVNRTVKLWDLVAGRERATLKGHADQALSVAFSPDGKRLVSGSVDGTAIVWDLATGQQLIAIKESTGPAAFSPDGKTLALTYGPSVRLHEAATDRRVVADRSR